METHHSTGPYRPRWWCFLRLYGSLVFPPLLFSRVLLFLWKCEQPTPRDTATKLGSVLLKQEGLAMFNRQGSAASAPDAQRSLPEAWLSQTIEIAR